MKRGGPREIDGAKRVSLGSGKVDRAQRRDCSRRHGAGGLRTESLRDETEFGKRSWRVRGDLV